MVGRGIRDSIGIIDDNDLASARDVSGNTVVTYQGLLRIRSGSRRKILPQAKIQLAAFIARVYRCAVGIGQLAGVG